MILSMFFWSRTDFSAMWKTKVNLFTRSRSMRVASWLYSYQYLRLLLNRKFDTLKRTSSKHYLETSSNTICLILSESQGPFTLRDCVCDCDITHMGTIDFYVTKHIQRHKHQRKFNINIAVIKTINRYERPLTCNSNLHRTSLSQLFFIQEISDVTQLLSLQTIRLSVLLNPTQLGKDFFERYTAWCVSPDFTFSCAKWFLSQGLFCVFLQFFQACN